MMTRKNRNLQLILAAAGTAFAANLANAQALDIQGPKLINISGATLLEGFLSAPASTNDFIDVDGDGQARSLGSFDQLTSLAITSPNYNLDGSGFAAEEWVVIYRATGSGNGFRELIAQGNTFDVTADGGPGILAANAENAYYNGVRFIDEDLGNLVGFDASNPGGAPARAVQVPRTLVGVDINGDLTNDTATEYLVVDDPRVDDSTDGIEITMSSIDVPPELFVRIPGGASPVLTPGIAGYGNNPRISPNNEGETADRAQTLADLGGLELFDPAVPATADVTIFGTPIAYVPLAYPVNYGVGKAVATVTELQWGFVSGRLPSGENLTFVARDSGSGTRNAAITSLCLDPSWGLGDGVGPKNSDGENGTIGSLYFASNKGGSGTMEETVRNTRLAIGHTGAGRGFSRGWLSNGEFDTLGIINDVNGNGLGAPVRPTIDAILNNSDPNTGYQFGGVSTFATIGDPRAEPAVNGGDNNGNPRMANTAGALYLNNITRSIESFLNDPPASENLFTPGEFLAFNQTLVAALDSQPDPLNPCIYVDGFTNQEAQDALLISSNLGLPEFGTFAFFNDHGISPSRLDDRDYNDGGGSGPGAYRTFNGATIGYGLLDWGGDGNDTLENANRVAGDFNNDGDRDLDDFALALDAWAAVNVGARTDFSGNQNISPELIGDHNSDGFFDRFDIRFMADGLAIDPDTGVLDRNEGFEQVDAIFGGNFFGTTLVTGAAYENGDARGDLANASSFGTTRGWAPVGAEGYNRDSSTTAGGIVEPAAANVIDAWDIEYVFDQFRGNDIDGNPVDIDGSEANWGADLRESGLSDLSADLTGDQVINILDVDELIDDILDTDFADANLDGTVNQADIDLVQDAIDGITSPADANNPLFTEGDLNGDDVIDNADLRIAQELADAVCIGDTDNDGDVDPDDLFALLAFFGNPDASGLGNGDLDGDGDVDPDDLFALLAFFGNNCN